MEGLIQVGATYRHAMDRTLRIEVLALNDETVVIRYEGSARIEHSHRPSFLTAWEPV